MLTAVMQKYDGSFPALKVSTVEVELAVKVPETAAQLAVLGQFTHGTDTGTLAAFPLAAMLVPSTKTFRLFGVKSRRSF